MRSIHRAAFLSGAPPGSPLPVRGEGRHGREEGFAMTAYLQGMWRCRYFWLSLVKMDLRARYRGSVFGLGWSLLQPVAMTIIFTTIFCRLFHQDPRSYAP